MNEEFFAAERLAIAKSKSKPAIIDTHVLSLIAILMVIVCFYLKISNEKLAAQIEADAKPVVCVECKYT